MKTFWFTSEREYNEFVNALECNNTDIIMDILFRLKKDGDLDES